MSLSDEQKDKYSTIFGLGLAAIGTFNVAVSSFVYNVLGGSMLTILFLLLFIFIIWILWNRGKAGVNESATEKIKSETEALKAEKGLKDTEAKLKGASKNAKKSDPYYRPGSSVKPTGAGI